MRRYDSELPNRLFQKFFDYIGQAEEEFYEVVDSFRSPHLWNNSGKNETGRSDRIIKSNSRRQGLDSRLRAAVMLLPLCAAER